MNVASHSNEYCLNYVRCTRDETSLHYWQLHRDLPQTNIPTDSAFLSVRDGRWIKDIAVYKSGWIKATLLIISINNSLISRFFFFKKKSPMRLAVMNVYTTRHAIIYNGF